MAQSKPVPITAVGEANNRFRQDMLLGNHVHHQLVCTRGISDLGPAVAQEILDLMLRFPDEDFRESFEPWGDRDFIVVQCQGLKVWGKIDCYDLSMEYLSPEPVDDAVTVRVLTLMLPDEY